MAYIKVPGNFPDREYSYCILGNGTDIVYIDWSGAMSFKDQINGNFAYWYKLDRKSSQKSDPLPLLRVKYGLISPAGPVEIEDSNQFFDPAKCIVTSVISAKPFSFKVRTFLTDRHLLIVEFSFQKIPEDSAICFALDDNRITYTGKIIRRLSHPVRYCLADDFLVAEFSHSEETSFYGTGLMKIIAPKDAEIKFFDRDIESNAPAFPYLSSSKFIQVKNLKKNDRIYCLTCVVDSLDADEPENVAIETIREFEKIGFQKIYNSHTGKWIDYSKQSKVSIADDIDYLYNLSNYILKAVQYKTGAVIPSALFPNNHGCLVYWDALFDEIGLLRTNHKQQARKIAEFWLLGLEKARENAKNMGGKGAYYGWATDFYGYDPDATKVNQIHFNGDIALSCWKYYEYTMDTNFLKMVFPVMKETIDFLISNWIESCKEGIRVKSCESLDESSYERVSDTWTTALIIKGIENILKSAGITGEKIDEDFYKEIANGLTRALERNVKSGVLYSHDGTGDLNVGSILSLIILEKIKGVDRARTFERFVRDVKEKAGLGWGHSSRMRCAIFPWSELIAAIFLAKNKSSLALTHLEKAVQATNSFGGFAEYIWIHGLISRNWYVSAHGTYLWAITEMLVSADGKDINIFPGFPDDKIGPKISFSNILIEGNILVSCKVIDDRIRLALYNPNDYNIDRSIVFRSKKLTISLKSETKLILTI